MDLGNKGCRQLFLDQLLNVKIGEEGMCEYFLYISILSQSLLLVTVKQL
jgi:hypothetical protein